MLTRVKTNKFGDVTCAKYKSVTPHTTIDGVRAMPKQIKVAPPKEKKRKAPPAIQIKVAPPKEKKSKAPLAILENEDKHPRMTIALLEKKIEDLSDIVYTLEHRIDEEHVYRKRLQQDLNAVNYFIAKTGK